jgi:general secretion pathway protein G
MRNKNENTSVHRIQVIMKHLLPQVHNNMQSTSRNFISPSASPLSKSLVIPQRNSIQKMLSHLFQVVQWKNFYDPQNIIHVIQRQHNFNMIEILIAISIIVTFSGLTGAKFAQKYEETRVSNAQLDLARIQEGLVMYYTRKASYPLDLEELLENGDLNKVPKDPWGTDYLYIPHLD